MTNNKNANKTSRPSIMGMHLTRRWLVGGSAALGISAATGARRLKGDNHNEIAALTAEEIMSAANAEQAALQDIAQALIERINPDETELAQAYAKGAMFLAHLPEKDGIRTCRIYTKPYTRMLIPASAEGEYFISDGEPLPDDVVDWMLGLYNKTFSDLGIGDIVFDRAQTPEEADLFVLEGALVSKDGNDLITKLDAGKTWAQTADAIPLSEGDKWNSLTALNANGSKEVARWIEQARTSQDPAEQISSRRGIESILLTHLFHALSIDGESLRTVASIRNLPVEHESTRKWIEENWIDADNTWRVDDQGVVIHRATVLSGKGAFSEWPTTPLPLDKILLQTLYAEAKQVSRELSFSAHLPNATPFTTRLGQPDFRTR